MRQDFLVLFGIKTGGVYRKVNEGHITSKQKSQRGSENVKHGKIHEIEGGGAGKSTGVFHRLLLNESIFC